MLAPLMTVCFNYSGTRSQFPIAVAASWFEFQLMSVCQSQANETDTVLEID